MEGLTMNRLALAGLRANRKEYRQMALGIFLAVFLAVGTALGIWAMWEKKTETKLLRFGKADGFLFGALHLEPDALERTGLISKIGTVSVLGTVDGHPFGYYDQEAEDLLCRQFLSGQMPQNEREIALEEAALNAICPGAALGDRVTLFLTSRSGQSQERCFTLAGILRSPYTSDANIDWTLQDAIPAYAIGLPQILVCANADPFQDDSPVRQFVFTFSEAGTLDLLHARFPTSSLLGVDTLGSTYVPEHIFFSAPSIFRLEYTAPVLSAGGALLLAAMIGIFDAASGQFARKEKQYRLLRAVGATRRQIVAVSRREAMLLALVLAPGAALCAVGFVKLCCVLLPEDAAFALPGSLLLGSLVLSFVLVWAAASLPVLWSFRGGVLEEKAPPKKKIYRTSSKSFSPARLLAWRNLRSQPFRTIGCIILVVLLNVTAVLLGVTSLESLDSASTLWDTQAFVAVQRSPGSYDGIGDQEVEALGALPGVSSVHIRRCAKTYGLTDRVGTYYPKLGLSNYHLRAYHPEITYDPEDLSVGHSAAMWQEWQKKIQSILNTDQIVISTYLLTVEDISFFSPYLLEGTIDEAAINSGQAILVFAPDYYIERSRYGRSVSTNPSQQKTDRNIEFVKNDQFLLGSTQALAQVDPDPDSYVPFAKKGQETKVSTASAEICGIVGPFQTNFWFTWDTPSIITTVQGAQGLGLDTGAVEHLTIELDGTVPDSVLEPQISGILGKDDYSLINNVARLRDIRRNYTATLLFLGSLFLAFLACTVTLLRGSRIRDIQAKADTIHILWSLGCEGKDLAAIWRREILYVFLVGFLISIAVELLLMRPTVFWGLKDYLFFSGISSILGAGLCLIGIKHTLQQCMEMEK